jgi:alpha-tubulin suppressor-like RCC1 family protein
MMKDASEAPIIALEEPIVQFAAGSGHRCVLLLSGKLRCTGDKWGFGPTVREDQYTDLYQAVPEFPDDVGVLQVGVSRWSTCALKRNGKVQCVGDNSEGIWGFGMEAEPTGGDIPFATPVKHIAVGVGHACALESSGEVRCWGGGGNEGYVVPAVDRPVIELDGEVVQLSAGNSHTCALLKDGRVQCWGDFRGPSLRSAPNTSFTDGLFELTTVDLGGSAVQIASGEQHACAVLATSAVRCWGSNGAGQLGYGLEVDGVYMMQHSNLPADAPTPASMGDVAVGGNVVQLTSKHNHTCALLDDDRLRCWSNYPVALGYADKEPRPVPRDDVPYR